MPQRPIGRATLLPIAIDRRARPGLQRQVYEQVRDGILAGRVAPGTRLPATRELARDIGVSRNTVVGAFEQLLAEGYVRGAVGSGTYVAELTPDALLNARLPSEAAPPIAAVARRRGLSERGHRIAGIHQPGRLPASGAFVLGPAVDLFPSAEWARLLARVWRRPEPAMMQYGDPAGDPPLRRAIADYLREVRALRCTPDQVIVVAGAQQGIDLAARVLTDVGDAALVEEPGYAGIRGALTAAGARLVPTPVDAEGLDIRYGEAAAPDARLACVAAARQYPLGMTMSLARRLALLHWAERRDAWIIEDDYDSEYRYGGQPVAALQGLDRTGRVIYVGSFSKVMFPSLRLGYLVVPRDLAEPIVRARAVLDAHPSAVTQLALAHFIDDGSFAAHIRRMRRLYAARQAALLAAAKRHWSGLLTVPPSESGMHLLATIDAAASRHIGDREIARRAGALGIMVQPLSAYYEGSAERQGLVLGFAAVAEEQMDQAAQALAAAITG